MAELDPTNSDANKQDPTMLNQSKKRMIVTVQGAVQGVGFRPFLFRLANRLQLAGWVRNTAQGVHIEVEGQADKLEQFLHAMQTQKPSHATIYTLEISWRPPAGAATFEILRSLSNMKSQAWILPDLSICSDCLKELFNPQNRRYLYPFINCTHCGPRFSILTALPYDRENTSMADFSLCPECHREFNDPGDRRFHAQPNACPVCGPHLSFYSPNTTCSKSDQLVLDKTAEALREGAIIAVKGIGGFHLMTDARNDESVKRLRFRKQRENKPLAVMFSEIAQVKRYCRVTNLEAEWLQSSQAPLLLLEKKQKSCFADQLAPSIAPDNPFLGVLLPYSPLHHLLMHFCGFPLIATSGNVAEETICIDNEEAIERLGTIADAFLLHNRRIVRHVDDSIGRMMAGQHMLLRRARGYVPMPISLAKELPDALAVGGQLKSTLAVSKKKQIFVSQHIGDLDSLPAWQTFQRIERDLSKLLSTVPGTITCDFHPDYRSTHFALSRTAHPVPVQHHLAHVFACMAENNIAPPVLGVAWDGIGYGLDGALWGGEFFSIKSNHWLRFAHFPSFPLLGGEQAIREPRRCAAALLFQLEGEKALQRDFFASTGLTKAQANNLFKLYCSGRHQFHCTSVGRLFDAVASLTDLQQINLFEGQAAQKVEFCAMQRTTDNQSFPFSLANHTPIKIEIESIIKAILDIKHSKHYKEIICKRFHNTLIEILLAIATRAACQQVVLSGGCFQNKLLVEAAIARLAQAGFTPIVHHCIPPNDGGISVGQLAALSYLPFHKDCYTIKKHVHSDQR